MIRGKTKKCPFGLNITDGCKSAGSHIFKMIPVESSDDEDAKEYNYRVLLAVSLDESYENIDKECAYADLILEDRNAVDCKYGDQINFGAAGNIPLNGSPIYPHMYVGNTTRSTQSYPLSYYSDDNIRSIYYGLISLLP